MRRRRALAGRPERHWVIAMVAVIGLTLGAVMGRLLATMFGVQPLDPVTSVSVTIVLAVTGSARGRRVIAALTLPRARDRT
jgi:uncharacterized membrane protein YoaK (UPF0700 family)